MKVKNQRKHVLIICPFFRPNLGGVETHIDKLINYAVKKGFYITLLTYQPLTRRAKGKKTERGENFEIHRVSWFGYGWFGKLESYFPLVFLYLFPGLFLKSLIFYLRHHKKIDCIHAHGLVSALIARILNLFSKKNIVVSTHAVYQFEKRGLLASLVKKILSGFNKILAVSDTSKDELIKMGLNSKKVEVHPNWIDTDIFRPKNRFDARNKLNFQKKFNLLFVGRFLEKKGIKLILDSAKKLPDYGFHLVGSGPLEATVAKCCETFKNIHYYGVLMQEDIKQFDQLIDLYNACDFLISPYLYDEGFSATLIESVACGTPVIITDRGSPPTFLNKKVAIFLSGSPTNNELINKLLDLHDKQDQFETMRLECRDYAMKNFGVKNADIIINNY